MTHAYSLKMFIRHNKNLNPLLNLLINSISSRSWSKILSMKNDCTFLLLNFLIIGLCNASVISLLDIISFLTGPQEIFFQKIYKPLKQDSIDIHHISNF